MPQRLIFWSFIAILLLITLWSFTVLLLGGKVNLIQVGRLITAS